MAYCGAKTRAGTPCKRFARKNGRCNLHGGKTPETNKNALKYGIYSEGIKDSEKDLWHEIKVGNLDDEIKIIKIQLSRAVKAQKEFEEEMASDGGNDKGKTGFELSEIKASNIDGKERKEITKKRPDFRKIIFQLSGRIAKLELTRNAINSDPNKSDGQPPTPVKVEIMVEDGRVSKP